VYIYKPNNLNLEELILRNSFNLTQYINDQFGKKNVQEVSYTAEAIVTSSTRQERRSLKSSKLLLKYTDYCYWFVHKILTLTYGGKNPDYNAFVNIDRNTIAKTIPSTAYVAVVEILEQLAVIEVNKNGNKARYSIGNFSKSFRINDDYYNIKLVQHEVTSKTLLKKFTTPEVKKELDPTGFVYNWILSSFQKERIELSKLPFFVHQQESLQKFYLDDEVHEAIEAVGHDVRRYNRYVITAHNFQFKTITISPKAYKVVHVVSYLPKALRQHLKVTTGNELKIYDFSSSHTAHLLKLLGIIASAGQAPKDLATQLEEHKKQMPTEAEYVGNQFDNGGKYLELSESIITGALPYRFVYNNDSIDFKRLQNEVQRLTELMTCGKFYEFLGQVLNDCRDNCKDIWLIGFLNRSSEYAKRIKPLVSLFPVIDQVLRWFQDYKKESGHSLASILQSGESYLVNRLILSEVAKQHSSSICINLYDGFITDTDIEDIINEQSKIYFGFEPVVTRKDGLKYLLAA
jgi:hypothetical protein